MKNYNDFLRNISKLIEKGVFSSKDVKKELENTNRTFLFNHPSTGGGGAHKCCSNILERLNEININDWIYFVKYYDMPVSDDFIKGVNNEIIRIKKEYSSLYN